MHLEVSASQYVTERLSLGVVGYLYNQITGDGGPAPASGPSCPGRRRRPAGSL